MGSAGIFLFAYAGWASCALAMDRHYRQLTHRPMRRAARVMLRVCGALCLVAAILASVSHWGWAIGIVAAVGILSTTGLGFVLLFPHWPRVAAAVAPLALLAAGASVIVN